MSSPESSLDLLRRLQAGDRSALDPLIERYRPRLVRWAAGRLPPGARDLAETQDLVQETLLRVFRKIESIEIRGDGALQAYLRQVLLNAIRMELRRVKRRPPRSELNSGIEDAAEPSPVERVVGRETLERYERSLLALRDADRELTILHLEFGLTHQELAEALGKPSANAARVSLHRALLRLAGEMKRAE